MRVADALEAELDAYVATLQQHVEAHLPGLLTPALGGAMRRAEVAIVRDSLARLRATSSPPDPFVPDAVHLVRLWFEADLPLALLAEARAVAEETFWSAYVRLATDHVTPEACWQVLRTAHSCLRGHAPSVLRLLRDTWDGLAGGPAREDDTLESKVLRALRGEPVPRHALKYDLGEYHLAIVSGVNAMERIRVASCRLNCRLLAIQREEGTLWAWLGRCEPVSAPDLKKSLCMPRGADERIGVGDPHFGPAGFGTSHEQACEAWEIASSGTDPLIFFSEVTLLVALKRDRSLLLRFVRRELGQLATNTAVGAELRTVVRAYLENGQNAVATASLLGCSRRTVERKLRSAEQLIGHILPERSSEVLIALRAIGLT
jgi:hypothetical protein